MGITVALCVLVALAPLPAAAVQEAPSATHEIGAVQVTGAKRYVPAEIAKLSGLAVGGPISVAALKPVAERLAGTGLFKSLSYRYVTAGRKMTVVFEIEEADWTIPVLFDNFVWFTDEEIVKAVRADVPSFDGTAPPAEGIPDLMLRSLQALLTTRNLPGRAHFSPQTDMKSASLQYLFSVKDPAPTLCALRVNGASALPERELLSAPGTEVGGAYSRFYLTNVSSGTLIDMYRRRGHWRAAFAAPTVTPDRGCGGVSAALNVSEGGAFAWERAEWTGNAAIPTGDLDAALGMKPGDLADASRIEAGLLRARALYRKQGYLTAAATYSPKLEDTSRRASFEMRVEEGPQFRMGTLAFEGITAADAEHLTKRWRLAEGAIYDDTYADTFRNAEIAPLTRGKPVTVSGETRVDAEQRVVHVKFLFKRGA